MKTSIVGLTWIEQEFLMLSSEAFMQKEEKFMSKLLMFIFSKLKEMRFALYSAIIDSITFPHFIRSTTQCITKQKIAYLLLKKIQKRCE